MVGGVDGTDRLTGSRPALLAHHRRVSDVDVAELFAVAGGMLAAGHQLRLAVPDVALDAKPGHRAHPADLLLAHHGNVVLQVAGGHAGGAAGAAVEVHRHPPAIEAAHGGIGGGLELLADLVAPVVLGFCLALLLAVPRCGEVRERDGFAELATPLVVRELKQRQTLVATGLVKARLLGQPGLPTALVDSGGKDLDHVGAAGLTRPPVSGAGGVASDAVTLSDGNRHHVVADAAARMDRNLDATRRGLDGDHIAELETQPLGGVEADLRPGLPCDAQHRIGDLLEPGEVRAPAVVQEGVGEGQQDEVALAAEHRLHHLETPGSLRQRHRGGRRLGELATAGECCGEIRIGPGLLEQGAEAARRELRGHLLTHGPGGVEERVSQRPGVVERPDGRLDQAADSIPRHQVPPGFQRRMVGQDQMGSLGGLVQHRGEGDHERHLRQRRFEAGRLGQRVDGIGVVHQQDADPPVLDGLHQGEDIAVAGAAPGFVLGRDPDRATDRSNHVVQDQNGRSRGNRPAGGDRDTRRDGDGVPGVGQRPPQADDGLGGQVGLLRDGVDVGVGQHAVEECSVLLRAPAALDRDAGQPQGQDALAAGPRGQPLVGVRPGLGEPWTHVHETRTAVRVGGDVARSGELPLVLHRRKTGVEDLVSEVHHQIRVGEVEPRLGVHAEDVAGGRAQCLGGKGLVDRAPGGSDGADEAIDQLSRGVAGVAAQHVDLGRSLGDFEGEQLDAGVPADRLELIRPVPQHRAPEAIRVVGATDRGLSPRAERPPVDRVLRISLELDGPPVEGLDVEPTGRGTFPAGRGVIERDARRDQLGLDHVGDQLLHVVGAAGRRGGSGADSDELQKIATVDLRHSNFSGVLASSALVVAEEAVRRRVVGPVAHHAPTHLQLLGGQAVLPPLGVGHQEELVHGFDQSVAALAGDTHRRHVTVVRELDVLRKAMDLDPGNRELVFPVLVQDPDSLQAVVLGRKLLVAGDADLDGRHPRHRQAIAPGVAVETVQLEPAGVMGVAEGNRLHRPGERLVPGRLVGPAGRDRGEELVELRGDLDLEIRLRLLQRLQLLRLTDAAGDEHLAAQRPGRIARALTAAAPGRRRRSTGSEVCVGWGGTVPSVG